MGKCLLGCCFSAKSCCRSTSSKDDDGEAGESDGGNENDSKQNLLLEAIVRDVIFPVINKVKLIFVLAAIGFGIASIFGARKLELPRDSAVEMLSASHVLTKYLRMQRSAFKSAAESQIEVDIVFGLRAKDDGDWNDPKSLPSLERDETFDMSSEGAQIWLRNFYEKARKRAHNNESRCWIEQFSKWPTHVDETKSQAGNSTFYNEYQVVQAWQTSCLSKKELPISQDKFIDRLYTWSHDSNTRYGGANFHIKDDAKFSDAIFDAKRENGIVVELYNSMKLLLSACSFSIDIGWNEEMSLLRSRWDYWKIFINTELESAPNGLKNGWQTDQGAWLWLDTVEQMNKNFFQAALMCLAIAFLIALLSTSNLIVTFLSIFSIGSILAATISIIVALGWTLGFLEGICLCILIGFSVDFIIHVAHAYCAAADKFHSRFDRTREAFVGMAFPIASAAFTTFLSALVLFFCTITFFKKFGTIIMISMVCAIIVSLLFYVSLLLTLGPEGNFGDLRKCKNVFTR